MPESRVPLPALAAKLPAGGGVRVAEVGADLPAEIVVDRSGELASGERADAAQVLGVAAVRREQCVLARCAQASPCTDSV